VKKFIKVTALALVFMLAVSLAGCGEIKKAETAVNNMFTALKAFDLEEAEKYVDLTNITAGDTENALSGNGKAATEQLFGKLEYEIIDSEKVDKNTVNVTTKITTVDMKSVFQEFIVKAMEYAFSNIGAEVSEAEQQAKMEEILVACIAKEDAKRVTKEVTIKVVKEDKQWKIQSDESFANAITGGLQDAINEINNTTVG